VTLEELAEDVSDPDPHGQFVVDFVVEEETDLKLLPCFPVLGTGFPNPTADRFLSGCQ
jgi:hypothetical protein